MNVLSARYGNEQNSLEAGVTIITDELGAVATCMRDAPHSGGAWQALQAWLAAGNTVAAYQKPISQEQP